MDWQERLISLYLYVCKAFKDDLEWYNQRMSSYSDLRFSDEEVVTIYLYGLLDKKTELKKIHEHAHDYWRDWFPNLPSYTAFIQRLNRLADVFSALTQRLHEQLPFDFDAAQLHLIDSMPIILAQRTRRFYAKVAPEICSPNGYCSTKQLYYYGVKLHAVACYQKGQLPIPASIQITPANVFDGKVYDDI
jgi:hypothetical protein